MMEEGGMGYCHIRRVFDIQYNITIKLSLHGRDSDDIIFFHYMHKALYCPDWK
jgi:hypothetical protein